MTNRQLTFTCMTGALVATSGALLAANDVIGWSLTAVGFGLLALAGVSIGKRTKPAPAFAKSEP